MTEIEQVNVLRYGAEVGIDVVPINECGIPGVEILGRAIFSPEMAQALMLALSLKERAS